MSTVLSIKDTSIICGHHPNGLHRPNCGYCLHHWSCGCYYPMRTSWSCANCPMMRNGLSMSWSCGCYCCATHCLTKCCGCCCYCVTHCPKTNCATKNCVPCFLQHCSTKSCGCYCCVCRFRKSVLLTNFHSVLPYYGWHVRLPERHYRPSFHDCHLLNARHRPNHVRPPHVPRCGLMMNCHAKPLYHGRCHEWHAHCCHRDGRHALHWGGRPCDDGCRSRIRRAIRHRCVRHLRPRWDHDDGGGGVPSRDSDDDGGDTTGRPIPIRSRSHPNRCASSIRSPSATGRSASSTRQDCSMWGKRRHRSRRCRHSNHKATSCIPSPSRADCSPAQPHADCGNESDGWHTHIHPVYPQIRSPTHRQAHHPLPPQRHRPPLRQPVCIGGYIHPRRAPRQQHRARWLRQPTDAPTLCSRPLPKPEPDAPAHWR